MMIRFGCVFGLILAALAGAKAQGGDSAKVDAQETRGRPLTRWAGDVDPSAPLPEYPRPQLVRDQWKNLNGRWEYSIAERKASRPDSWDGRIVVPFAPESSLSGVQRRVGVDKRLWYRRTFDVPHDWRGGRVLLHFGAVDWETTVWVNNKNVGTHRGGYDPFSLDITDALHGGGDQELLVAVWDPTDDGPQPRGKQTDEPKGIWYTPVTGIWQTVWLEPVPDSSIERLDIVPDFDAKRMRVTVNTRDAKGEQQVVLKVTRLSQSDEEATTPDVRAEGRPGEPIVLDLGDDAKAWSPDEPWLYQFEALLVDAAAGEPVDTVTSYFGLRKIAVAKDAEGVDRLFVNGQPLFQFGPLDQGWWPDGLYTAPTDEALRYDIEFTKEVGFNMARKHVKVEPARWYYWADKLGLLVWQDMPHGMQGGGRGQNHVMRNQADLELPEQAREIFRRELKAMIDALDNHPSIVVWVPFNEGWGQHDTNDILRWTKEYDPTRLVDGPSGWADRGYGDMKDVHSYPGPDMPALEEGRAAVLGEFGGLGLPVTGHLWETRNNWGYRTYETADELQVAYKALVDQLPGLIQRGLAAAVYTQTTDVEIEVNGLITYDREVVKFDPERLREWNQQVIHSPISTADEASATSANR